MLLKKRAPNIGALFYGVFMIIQNTAIICAKHNLKGYITIPSEIAKS
jgi:hypothetical protein